MLKGLFSKNNSKGFSLVELIVYIFLLGLVLLAVSELSIIAIESNYELEIRNNLQQEGRFIMQRITFDAGRAQSLPTSPPLCISLPGSKECNFTFVLEDGTELEYFASISSLSSELRLTEKPAVGPAIESNLVSNRINLVDFDVEKVGINKPTLKIVFTLTSAFEQKGQVINETFSFAAGLR